MKESRRLIRLFQNGYAYFVIVTVSVFVSCWLGSAGLPAPQGDESFSKSPAVELALNGRLTIPCAKGFLPHAETLFAVYPPLYQLFLAGWYAVCGFSWKSSLAFNYVVHSFNAVAISAAASFLLKGNKKLSPPIRIILIAAPGLIHVANLAYFDRSEELALLWIWLELLFVQGTGRDTGIWRSLGSGVLIGMAALTVPWVGVLGVLVVTLRSVSTHIMSTTSRSMSNWRKAILALVAVGVVSASMAWGWKVIMDHFHPGVIDEQLSFVYGYHEQTQLGGTIAERLHTFIGTVFFNPPQLSATIVALLFFPPALLSSAARESNSRDSDSTAVAIYLAGLLGILLVAFIRPGAYPYLGACQMLVLPCFGPAMSRFVSYSAGRVGFVVGIAVIILCALLAFGDVGRLFALKQDLPESEQPDAVFQRLSRIIPEDVTVAVTPRHWCLFQNRNDWREAYFCSFGDPPGILECEWLVLYPEVGIPAMIDEFEFVSGNPKEAAKPGSYEFSVWRRRRPNENATQ